MISVHTFQNTDARYHARYHFFTSATKTSQSPNARYHARYPPLFQGVVARHENPDEIIGNHARDNAHKSTIGRATTPPKRGRYRAVTRAIVNPRRGKNGLRLRDNIARDIARLIASHELIKGPASLKPHVKRVAAGQLTQKTGDISRGRRIAT